MANQKRTIHRTLTMASSAEEMAICQPCKEKNKRKGDNISDQKCIHCTKCFKASRRTGRNQCDACSNQKKERRRPPTTAAMIQVAGDEGGRQTLSNGGAMIQVADDEERQTLSNGGELIFGYGSKTNNCSSSSQICRDIILRQLLDPLDAPAQDSDLLLKKTMKQALGAFGNLLADCSFVRCGSDTWPLVGTVAAMALAARQTSAAAAAAPTFRPPAVVTFAGMWVAGRGPMAGNCPYYYRMGKEATIDCNRWVCPFVVLKERNYEATDAEALELRSAVSTIIDSLLAGPHKEHVGAIAVELIGGQSGLEIPSKFFKSLRQLCNEKKILLVADEILSGLNCGSPFMFPLKKGTAGGPDLVLFGKAFGIAGVLLMKKTVEDTAPCIPRLVDFTTPTAGIDSLLANHRLQTGVIRDPANHSVRMHELNLAFREGVVTKARLLDVNGAEVRGRGLLLFCTEPVARLLSEETGPLFQLEPPAGKSFDSPFTLRAFMHIDGTPELLLEKVFSLPTNEIEKIIETIRDGPIRSGVQTRASLHR